MVAFPAIRRSRAGTNSIAERGGVSRPSVKAWSDDPLGGQAGAMGQLDHGLDVAVHGVDPARDRRGPAGGVASRCGWRARPRR